jgi:hypothetical protein
MNATELAAAIGMTVKGEAVNADGSKDSKRIAVRTSRGSGASIRLAIFASLTGCVPLTCEEGATFFWATFDAVAFNAVNVTFPVLPEATKSPAAVAKDAVIAKLMAGMASPLALVSEPEDFDGEAN